MNRLEFIRHAGLIGSGVLLNPFKVVSQNTDQEQHAFPIVRPSKESRHFSSEAIEKAIKEFKTNVKDEELGWLFENCFPNTLDTTVFLKSKGKEPDTYIITGDIDAMWLRDSTAQIWPYLPFMKSDPALQNLIAGVINRQTKCILKDPYANAFYDDSTKISEWKDDLTDMKPGIHERKWEIDSLCYPIRLSYHYWMETKDTSPFNEQWKLCVKTILKTFKEQQRKENLGPYTFQRTTSWATDGVPLSGYGYPVKPNGLICSTFRPSDDATVFSYLIPSNFFAVVSLRQASKMVDSIFNDHDLAKELDALATEVMSALQSNSTVNHPQFGKIYAYEVNGMGSCNLMDDANVPSLLSLPYLGAIESSDEVYRNTRKFLLSDNNPFYYKGTAADGIGGPHAGADMIWPLSIVIKGLTSNDDKEIRDCIRTLKLTHGGTGLMHESFHKNDPKKFTRKWFAWANTIFGEFLWKVYKTKPQLLIS
ncbi:MAG TPA: glycoside hydrolase family 125 protein [Cyclobacteriaceae bacterium]|nr:glycoside hydrolase family 125 protein [Cyclobacteriaceae bacterium]